MINETNYHLYLDDFVNGLLNEELEMDFVAFLDQHPGILEDESLTITHAELPASFKDSLKREVSVSERSNDDLLIGSMEGDLTPFEELELNKRLKTQPALQYDKSLFALTRQEADLSIRFPNKSSLKKRPIIFMYSRWVASAAAVFILGMLVFRFVGQNQPVNPVAIDTPVVQPAFPSKTNPAATAPVRVSPTTPKEKQEGPVYTSKLRIEEEPKEILEKSTILVEGLTSIPQSIQSPELQREEPALVAYTIESPSRQEFVSNEQSVWQWAYKKVRGRVGESELIIPEREIPRDAANLVLAKVAPVFQYNQNQGGSLIRIGGLEINRRSTR